MVEKVVEVVLGAEGGIRLDFLATFDWLYCNEPNLLEIVLRMSCLFEIVECRARDNARAIGIVLYCIVLYVISVRR